MSFAGRYIRDHYVRDRHVTRAPTRDEPVELNARPSMLGKKPEEKAVTPDLTPHRDAETEPHPKPDVPEEKPEPV